SPLALPTRTPLFITALLCGLPAGGCRIVSPTAPVLLRRSNFDVVHGIPCDGGCAAGAPVLQPVHVRTRGLSKTCTGTRSRYAGERGDLRAQRGAPAGEDGAAVDAAAAQRFRGGGGERSQRR